MVTSRDWAEGVRDVEVPLENSSCRDASPSALQGSQGYPDGEAGGIVGKDRNGHGTVQTQLARHTCYVAKPQGDAKTWYAISCHTSASTREAASMCCRAEDRRTHP